MSGTRDPLTGLVLDGRFRLEERVGIGGMGAVYRARQLNVDRDVAVKVLHPQAAEDPEHVRRFENEAKIIARLRDPHPLKLIDFGRMDGGQLYIVTEYLAGRSLKQVLDDEDRLEARVARSTGRPSTCRRSRPKPDAAPRPKPEPDAAPSLGPFIRVVPKPK